MAPELSPEQKLALIKEQLAEIMNLPIIENIVLKEQRPLIVYWGTATTGRPHCGYFVPMVKLAHFLRAGCTVKILLADVHAFLDNLKAPRELVKYRAEYYRLVIMALLRAVNVPIEQLEFVLGSSYQRGEAYVDDLFALTTLVSQHDGKKAGAEVVKQADDPPISGLLYPLMQTLDEEHLGVDVQFGGVDQRKIFALATEQLPKLGYKKRAHMMNPMVPGLAGGKMSASDPDSKIDLLDTADVVKKKLKKAYAAPGEVEGNGLISFVDYVLLQVSGLSSPDGKGKFEVETREGEPLVYTDIETLKADYKSEKLTPQLLKSGVTTALINLLAPIQKEFLANLEFQEVERKAYPPAEPEKKKKKEKKDKGSKYPGGAAQVIAQPDGHVEGPEKEQVDVGGDFVGSMEKLDVKA